MTLSELIEQLELIKKDHPEAAQLPVRDTGGLDTFMVNLADDGDDGFCIEIEFYRPWAIKNDRP